MSNSTRELKIETKERKQLRLKPFMPSEEERLLRLSILASQPSGRRNQQAIVGGIQACRGNLTALEKTVLGNSEHGGHSLKSILFYFP
jgi:hypothetical protein